MMRLEETVHVEESTGEQTLMKVEGSHALSQEQIKSILEQFQPPKVDDSFPGAGDHEETLFPRSTASTNPTRTIESEGVVEILSSSEEEEIVDSQEEEEEVMHSQETE